ncbi:hypothetical protein Droror1_Dr00003599 [Drosera rotundifolia]
MDSKPSIMSSSTAFQWFSLVAVILLQSINGTNSNFPAYSSELKQILSLTQVELNNLAFASDAGKLLGWFSGIAAVYLPLWVVLMIGSLLGLIGYGFQYLYLSHHIGSLSYWNFFVLTIIAGNSICWINTVSYIVSVRNFPFQREVAVGLTTSYIGLSPVIYTAIVNALSSTLFRRSEHYLLLNSILPLIAAVIASPFIRNIDIGSAKKQEVGFMVVSMITIGTGVYAIVISLGESSLSPFLNMIGMVLCLLAPVIVPLAECLKGLVMKISETRQRVTDVYAHDQAVVVVEKGMKEEADTIMDLSVLATMEEARATSMIRRLNFWLYFFVYLSGATLGLVYLNNLGQIAESRGCTSVTSLVSVSSAFGFFGRLFPCLQHYLYLRSKHRVSGPASILAMMVPISGAFFLLLNGSSVTLYISTAIIGACTGAITTIAVSVTTELFGIKNFGVNHNVVVANIPIGSFLFGYLAAHVYREERHGQPICMGLDCYRSSFVLWGCLCSFGTVLAVILHIRTRKFYSTPSSTR